MTSKTQAELIEVCRQEAIRQAGGVLVKDSSGDVVFDTATWEPTAVDLEWIKTQATKATGYAVECDLAGGRVLMHEYCYTDHCEIYEIPSEGNPDHARTMRVVPDASGDTGAITSGAWSCDHCHDVIL